MNARDIAVSTLNQHITQNSYPGRGLVIGKSTSGDSWQQIYWIMGRSSNSRNRHFTVDGSLLRTEPFDLSKVEDPSLIIYEAMLELPGKFLVSNGDQTRTLHDGLSKGLGMKEALLAREREPDGPTYTPRITGMLSFKDKVPEIALSILKANKIDPAFTDRHYFFPQHLISGIGYGLTTYMCDGNPVPTFSGDPLLLPIAGTADETLKLYWSNLNHENRISIAVKEILPASGTTRIVLKNKYKT